MAVFDDIIKAIYCAVEIQQKWERAKGKSPGIKIGIDFGMVTELRFNDNKRDYLGMIVDRAFRLCSMANESQILISEAIYSPIINRFRGSSDIDFVE